MKLGRNRPVAIGPHFRLRNYLLPSMPAVPPTVDYSAPAATALRDILGNDVLGDCVIAAAYHMVELETANAGALWVPTLDEVIADYSAIGGYVIGDASTDQGCDEATALNYWQRYGFANGTKLLGWLTVKPSDLRAAIYLFENSFLTFEVPDAWISPFPSGDGFIWDVAPPNPKSGHAVVAVGYDTLGVQIDSWGLRGTVTWAAVTSLCNPTAGGGLYVTLTPDQLARGDAKAPNGFAWGDLVSDFNTMGGAIPLPISAPPTLADVQAWASAGLAANWPK